MRGNKPARALHEMTSQEEAALGRDQSWAHDLAAALAVTLKRVEARLAPFLDALPAEQFYRLMRQDVELARDNLASWEQGLPAQEPSRDGRLEVPLLEGEGMTEAQGVPERCPRCQGEVLLEVCDRCDGIGALGATLPRTGGPCPDCQETGFVCICYDCEATDLEQLLERAPSRRLALLGGGEEEPRDV